MMLSNMQEKIWNKYIKHILLLIIDNQNPTLILYSARGSDGMCNQICWTPLSYMNIRRGTLGSIELLLLISQPTPDWDCSLIFMMKYYAQYCTFCLALLLLCLLKILYDFITYIHKQDPPLFFYKSSYQPWVGSVKVLCFKSIFQCYNTGAATDIIVRFMVKC